jgi:hypothetical protein
MIARFLARFRRPTVTRIGKRINTYRISQAEKPPVAEYYKAYPEFVDGELVYPDVPPDPRWGES